MLDFIRLFSDASWLSSLYPDAHIAWRLFECGLFVVAGVVLLRFARLAYRKSQAQEESKESPIWLLLSLFTVLLALSLPILYFHWAMPSYRVSGPAPPSFGQDEEAPSVLSICVDAFKTLVRTGLFWFVGGPTLIAALIAAIVTIVESPSWIFAGVVLSFEVAFCGLVVGVLASLSMSESVPVQGFLRAFALFVIGIVLLGLFGVFTFCCAAFWRLMIGVEPVDENVDENVEENPLRTGRKRFRCCRATIGCCECGMAKVGAVGSCALGCDGGEGYCAAWEWFDRYRFVLLAALLVLPFGYFFGMGAISILSKFLGYGTQQFFPDWAGNMSSIDGWRNFPIDRMKTAIQPFLDVNFPVLPTEAFAWNSVVPFQFDIDARALTDAGGTPIVWTEEDLSGKSVALAQSFSMYRNALFARPDRLKPAVILEAEVFSPQEVGAKFAAEGAGPEEVAANIQKMVSAVGLAVLKHAHRPELDPASGRLFWASVGSWVDSSLGALEVSDLVETLRSASATGMLENRFAPPPSAIAMKLLSDLEQKLEGFYHRFLVFSWKQAQSVDQWAMVKKRWDELARLQFPEPTMTMGPAGALDEWEERVGGLEKARECLQKWLSDEAIAQTASMVFSVSDERFAQTCSDPESAAGSVAVLRSFADACGVVVVADSEDAVDDEPASQPGLEVITSFDGPPDSVDSVEDGTEDGTEDDSIVGAVTAIERWLSKAKVVPASKFATATHWSQLRQVTSLHKATITESSYHTSRRFFKRAKFCDAFSTEECRSNPRTGAEAESQSLLDGIDCIVFDVSPLPRFQIEDSAVHRETLLSGVLRNRFDEDKEEVLTVCKSEALHRGPRSRKDKPLRMLYFAPDLLAHSLFVVGKSVAGIFDAVLVFLGALPRFGYYYAILLPTAFVALLPVVVRLVRSAGGVFRKWENRATVIAGAMMYAGVDEYIKIHTKEALIAAGGQEEVEPAGELLVKRQEIVRMEPRVKQEAGRVGGEPPVSKREEDERVAGPELPVIGEIGGGPQQPEKEGGEHDEGGSNDDEQPNGEGGPERKTQPKVPSDLDNEGEGPDPDGLALQPPAPPKKNPAEEDSS